MSRVLVAAVDPGAVESLARALERDGHDVTVGGVLDGGVLDGGDPDVLLLDVCGAPGKGARLCRDARSAFATVPILVISESDDECDVVECLDAGADDYVTRPLRLAELLAWVRAMLRRGGPPGSPACDVRVDPASRRAWAGDTELSLTGREFDLLRVFVAHAGQVVSRETIMREVWGSGWWGSAKTLDMHVSSLRRKLGDDIAAPRHITTVRGKGFRLERD